MSTENRIEDPFKVGALLDATANPGFNVSDEKSFAACLEAVRSINQSGFDAAQRTLNDLKMANVFVAVEEAQAPAPNGQNPQMGGGVLNKIGKAGDGGGGGLGGGRYMDAGDPMRFNAMVGVNDLREGRFDAMVAGVKGQPPEKREAYIRALNDQLVGSGVRISFGTDDKGNEDRDSIVVKRATEVNNGGLRLAGPVFFDFSRTDNIKISLKDGTMSTYRSDNDVEAGGKELNKVQDLDKAETCRKMAEWLKLCPDKMTAGAVFADLSVERPTPEKIIKLLNKAHELYGKDGAYQLMETVNMRYAQLADDFSDGRYPKAHCSLAEVKGAGKKPFVITMVGGTGVMQTFEWTPPPPKK